MANPRPYYPELESLLKSFSYKPNWKFRIDWEVLVITAQVIDADKPHKIIPLQFSSAIPPITSLNWNWTQWLRHLIMDVERHECDEFFQINGEKPFDPHAGEQRG